MRVPVGCRWLDLHCVSDSLEESEERVVSYLPYKSDLLHDTLQIFGITFNPVAKHQNPNRKSMESLSDTLKDPFCHSRSPAMPLLGERPVQSDRRGLLLPSGVVAWVK